MVRAINIIIKKNVSRKEKKSTMADSFVSQSRSIISGPLLLFLDALLLEKPGGGCTDTNAFRKNTLNPFALEKECSWMNKV